MPVPRRDRERYVHHLMEHVVSPSGRLIIGKNNEDRGQSMIADSLRAWGWPGVREARAPHAHPDVEMTVVWLDQPR